MPRATSHPGPWRARFLPLCLALALGPAALAAPVVAAPAADAVKFAMEVAPRSGLLKPLCMGQTQPFYVSVTRTTQKSIGDQIFDFTALVLGVTVFGAADDPQVGSLTLTSGRYTGGAALSTFQTVEFLFKAKKAGTTTLRFTGKVDWHWLPGATDAAVQASPDGYRVPLETVVTVKVKACRVKASAVHRWSGPGALLIGTMEETYLTANEDGHYTGAGTLNWVASTVVPECVSTDTFAPSPVELSGDMDDSGQIAVTLTYEPAVDSATIRCEAPGRGIYEDRSWTVLASPDPLNVQVSSFGGVTQPAQVLVGEQSSSTGTAVVIVLPVDDDAPAAALNRRLLGAGLADFLARLLVPFAPRMVGR